MKLSFINISTRTLKINTLRVTTQDDSEKAITRADAAINVISSERAKLGALQNRLEHTVRNLTNTSENLQSAESRIRDQDMAFGIMELAKTQILTQAATAMLAQATQIPQGVLRLLH
jgi:flagellin